MLDSLPGEVLALLTTLSWSIGIFPFTEASKRIGAAAVNTFRLLMAFIIVTLILLVFYSMSVNEIMLKPDARQFVFLVASGIVGFTAGDYLGFTSFVKLGPRLASLYTTLAPGFALLFGFLMLNEKINLMGVVGIVVTISGVALLTMNKSDRISSMEKGFTRDKTGIIFGIASAFCQGLGLTLSKKGMIADESTAELIAVHANWIRLLGGFGSSLIISFFTGNLMRYAAPVFRNEKNGTLFMIAGTIFGPVLGVSLSLLTISKLNVAVAQTIFALLPVFVLPLNSIFYKEKISWISVLACMISVGGVLILVWRENIF